MKAKELEYKREKKVFNVMSKYGRLKFWKDFHQN